MAGDHVAQGPADKLVEKQKQRIAERHMEDMDPGGKHQCLSLRGEDIQESGMGELALGKETGRVCLSQLRFVIALYKQLATEGGELFK